MNTKIRTAHPALRAAALAVATWLTASAANAQSADWPAKPIRLVIPFPAGGGPERTIRAVADGLGQRLGQPVVVDYKPGASGNIGAAETARSAADGYTWLLAQESIVTVNPHIFKRLGYEPEKLFPVALFGSFVNVLTCHPAVGVRSVAELVEKAKAKPGSIRYASSGPGSPGHLAMEMFTSAAKIDMVHIPYRGPMPAVQDLLGGHVDCGFLVASIVAEYVKNKRLVGLAGSGTKPSASLGDLPNLSDAGYRDVNATFWLGIFGPTGVDPDITRKFHQALAETVRSEPVQAAMLASDTQPESTTPAQARQQLNETSARWASVVQRIHLKLD
ncbi:MAG: tripartite tricarboxylate transporter substrate binding protein [Hydrogenophaga sp.]|uniref:Bug family tripartite tricarboxylate transporter substrate binding protein n=1 Tax=Hydrogenophaga sp. TaxID=1904254 RepID=UPI002716ECCB|nr:tripartite tricarboxylate transporter substrate binding protein [Hydrogenophaga sp.]MDO9482741.1 tripartite tricarboxylate transporter substrate binding protein [Hydrogenophaga sp.]MDP3345333.1 tripartite tricarboxylate transporter substrate binding protein [Hydrogenophaga sp.]MDP3806134.1 tripartite tricarboxylate transporter substrate binding protein [Hydrogenophaga sp.]